MRPDVRVALANPGAVWIVGNEPEDLKQDNLTPEMFAERYKIISEAKMFPSDRYLLETQAQFHGFDPDEAIIEITPPEGEFLIREEDILAAIEEHADELALVFFGGVNYFTGQLFDMPKLTDAAHAAGALAAFDLAHAAGNVPLALHDWNVDFACWCSYKYLNSGPGAVAGLHVAERHGVDSDLTRLEYRDDGITVASAHLGR